MTISAVLTTFNRRELVLEALKSVKSQTRPPDEILVIDDGSDDGTGESLQGEDIRYHRQENAGSSAARNAGWRLASGDWIAYLDADDLWEKEKLAQQAAALSDDPELEAVFGHAANFAALSDQAFFDSQKHRLGVAIPAWLPSAALVRRSLLEETGGFDPSLKKAEVIDWIMRLRRRNTRMLMLPQLVLQRRLHRGNKQLDFDISQRENFALLRRWQELRHTKA